MSDQLPAPAASNTFGRIKRVNAGGQESWSARALARVLEYLNFHNFQPVIEKARVACTKSGHAVAGHFAEMRNMVDIGVGASGRCTARFGNPGYSRLGSLRSDRAACLGFRNAHTPKLLPVSAPRASPCSPRRRLQAFSRITHLPRRSSARAGREKFHKLFLHRRRAIAKNPTALLQ